MTAVRDGRSVDTTMGFSPLEGVPMTTRSGSIDPGALIYLLRERGLDAETLEHALNFESGMKALSGGSGDIRDADGLALDVFAYRVSAAVAAMAVRAERSRRARLHRGDRREFRSAYARRSVHGSAFSASSSTTAANERAEPDCRISQGDVAVHVVRAREELVAARAAREVLG